MSPPPRRRAPTWRELERFCEADGWTEIRTTGHRFFRKTLATGEVLETHSSLAGGGTMSQGRFDRRRGGSALSTRTAKAF